MELHPGTLRRHQAAPRGHGAHRIARVLNEDGAKNPRTGGQWSKGTVASILRTAKRLGSQTPPPYDAYP